MKEVKFKLTSGVELGIPELLTLIGAIVSIILGLLDIFSFSIGLQFFSFLGFGWIWNLIWGIVAIGISIGLLTGLGLIKSITFKITGTWVLLLILGIVILVPTGNYGGWMVLAAGIYRFSIEAVGGK